MTFLGGTIGGGEQAWQANLCLGVKNRRNLVSRLYIVAKDDGTDVLGERRSEVNVPLQRLISGHERPIGAFR